VNASILDLDLDLLVLTGFGHGFGFETNGLGLVPYFFVVDL